MIIHDAPTRRYTKYRPVAEDEDDDGILKPGEFIRVPLVAMDEDQPSYPLASEPARGKLYDAFGRPAGHRPGYVFCDNSDARAKAQAVWDAHGEWLRNAWRNPGPIRTGQ